jgi:hypothetical protein
LAQDFRVAATVPPDAPDRYWFFLNTGFAALEDGTLLAAGAQVVVGKGVVAADGTSDCSVVIARSVDRGATWAEAARIPFRNRMEVALYARGTTVYLMVGLAVKEGVILAAASEDRGSTWSEPIPVIRWAGAPRAGGRDKPGDWEVPTEAVTQHDHWFASNQTATVEKDGRLYMNAGEAGQTMAVAVCDLARGFLNPQAWRISDQVAMPVPREVNRGLFPGPAMRCVEGNVILANDRLRILARACIDRYATGNLAAVFDIEDDGRTPRLTFTQFYPLPGGNGKFFIVYDEPSRLFWMASNPPANTQGWVESPPGMPLGNDRRFLMLWYACDALNWFPAGCLARTEHLTDDLAILVRTSKHYSGLQAAVRARNGFHDANLMTFHRVKDFRSLAMNIRPQP